MATDFVQTDSEADPSAIAALCSGNSSNPFGTKSNQCDRDGTAGSSTRAVTMPGRSVDLNCVWMEFVNLDGYDGAAGDWTWRINITLGMFTGRLDEVHICHVDSGYVVKNTLASGTGLGVDVGSTGVKSGTLTQASSVSFALGDKIIVIFAFDNPQIATNAFSYRPDQVITGPGEIVRILGGQWVAGEVYVPGFQAGQVAE